MKASDLIRHWPLIVLAILIGAGAGVGSGLARQPRYTATAVLNVGRLDADTQAVPGFVEGAKSLASSYSRVAQSDLLLRDVADRLRLPLSEVRADVTAVPVPSAPIFRIRAEADSEDAAVRLVRATTERLTSYIANQTRSGGAPERLLREYQRSYAVALRRRSEARRLERARAALPGTVTFAQLDAARVRASVAELEAQTTGSLYAEARRDASGAAAIRLLDPGTTASSDRGETLQRLLFLGLVAGGVIGAGLALLRSVRRRTPLAHG